MLLVFLLYPLSSISGLLCFSTISLGKSYKAKQTSNTSRKAFVYPSNVRLCFFNKPKPHQSSSQKEEMYVINLISSYCNSMKESLRELFTILLL